MGVPVFMEKDRFTGVVQFFGELVFLEEVGLRGDMESELRGEPKPPLLPESLREAFNLPAVPVRYFLLCFSWRRRISACICANAWRSRASSIRSLSMRAKRFLAAVDLATVTAALCRVVSRA